MQGVAPNLPCALTYILTVHTQSETEDIKGNQSNASLASVESLLEFYRASNDSRYCTVHTCLATITVSQSGGHRYTP